jgi:hypothetical protein
MAKIDDAAILKRAKELCERDGNAWGPERSNRRQVDEATRRQYLARAREQLLEEGTDA